MNIYFYRCQLPLHGYPCLDINVILVWIIEHEDPKIMDIRMLISVDFWRSMYGYAIDSRTREPSRQSEMYLIQFQQLHIAQFPTVTFN